MRISLRPHLRIRLKQRRISADYPKKILSEMTQSYFDPITNHCIAVGELFYSGRMRPMVVVYDKIKSLYEIITIYPTSFKEINNRIKAKRWMSHPFKGDISEEE